MDIRHVMVIAAATISVATVTAFKTWDMHRRLAAWTARQVREPAVELDGDITRSRFVEIIDAPVGRVEALVWDVENLQHTVPVFKTSTLIDRDELRKRMKIILQPEAQAPSEWHVEFHLDRDTHRVTFANDDQETPRFAGEYDMRASPDGSRTRLEYSTVIRGQGSLPDRVRMAAEHERFGQIIESLRRIAAAS